MLASRRLLLMGGDIGSNNDKSKTALECECHIMLLCWPLLEVSETAHGKGMALPSEDRFGRFSLTNASTVFEELRAYLPT